MVNLANNIYCLTVLAATPTVTKCAFGQDFRLD